MNRSFWRPSKVWSYGLLLAIASIVAILLGQVLPGDRWAMPPDLSRAQLGGITTVNNQSSKAFGLPAPGLTPAEMDLHRAGDLAFDAIFVTAPAEVNPGLGPRFNNNACAACHIGNGRGLPQMGQALVRVSLPGDRGVAIDPAQGIAPVPGIGAQIRDRAVHGQLPDAKVTLNWIETVGRYPDGAPYRLRQPAVVLEKVDQSKPIPTPVQTSLRIPPSVFGAGLLEAIPADALTALADPGDADHDGISGRINRVWNPETEAWEVGRFGLKASSPSLRHQTAAAYAHDMGVSNPLFPDPDGSRDIDESTLEATTFYTQSLGVPAQRLLDNAGVVRGERLFEQANCAACHRRAIATGPSPIQALSHQTIHPYTDLLLHDMGAGLADHRPDFDASGQEWRTPPLWGLGLVQTVLPYASYLHDGRARTLEEAILWHGGEAEAAKAAFVAMAPAEREAVLQFLGSL